MKRSGYSLVEVVIAAAIVAIGIGAGAVLMNTLVLQGELSAAEVRAANLQEQAILLYRLGITNPAALYAILPEPTSGSVAPATGTFGLSFSAASRITNSVTLATGGSVPIAYDLAMCRLVFANPVAGTGDAVYVTNSLDIIRPTVRVDP